MAALADPATIKRWREHPPVYVRERFGVEPDPWQDDVLADFPTNPLQTMQACKGPGKTALLAWLGWNFLETRPYPKVAAVSITKENLRDNLWSEMAKWQQRSETLRELFQWTGGRIFLKEFPETWWMSARAFSKSASADEQSATLAGIHADYVMFLIDESGAMPPSVVATAEAALSSAKEAHVVQAGNPLDHAGALYAASKSKRWKPYEITGDPDDPKRSSRVSIDWARSQILEHGRDNSWVMVNVLGKFAAASINALLSLEEIETAARRSYQEDAIALAAKILGVDVARYGDDASVIFPRQGLVAFTPLKYRNINSIQGAQQVAVKWQEWEADACFIDDSGGYGSGWIDNLSQLGQEPIGIQFAGKALDQRYFNKRAEMHWLKAEWIKNGGQIPNIPELIRALSETTYTYQGDKLLIEPKDQIKIRLGFSPDEDDALGLTFAVPVAKKNTRHRIARMRADYSPMAAFDREHARGGINADYRPYGHA
jgi:phage terminase large subunit